MATKSRLKNMPQAAAAAHAPSSRGVSKTQHLKELPVPLKPHPGYPGHGPPLPGKVFRGGTARMPSGTDRYFPEWSGQNIRSNQSAETERLAAERLLKETQELIAEARNRARHDAREVEARFRQRVGDIEFWKKELEQKLAELKDGTENLDSQLDRVESALSGCTSPLEVSEQCLAFRAQRQGCDLIEDNVQKHLEFEVDTLKNSQLLLTQTKLQVAEERRLLLKRMHEVEHNLADKEMALDIDQHTSILKVSGPEKKKGVTRYPAMAEKKSVLTPSNWQENTERTLQDSSGQLKSASALESMCDGILAHVASHLRSQKDLTDRAFERRLSEVREAKRLLEEQLTETVLKVHEMEEAIISLEKAVEAKQGPLATCQLRIQQRKQRPSLELVVDDVDLQLQSEAQNLITSINRLEAQLLKARNCYASLQKSRLELETQISVKANSIYIDDVKCGSIRRGVNIQAY